VSRDRPGFFKPSGRTRRPAVAQPQSFDGQVVRQKERTMYRQGDVLIVPVDSVPGTLDPIEREEGRIILAYGEVTGHAHAIKAESAALFRDPKLMAVFLTVDAGGAVALEHDTMHLPPGNYQVIRPREYSPEKIRNVAD
jgi:hypothetical protein